MDKRHEKRPRTDPEAYIFPRRGLRGHAKGLDPDRSLDYRGLGRLWQGLEAK